MHFFLETSSTGSCVIVATGAAAIPAGNYCTNAVCPPDTQIPCPPACMQVNTRQASVRRGYSKVFNRISYGGNSSSALTLDSSAPVMFLGRNASQAEA